MLLQFWNLDLVLIICLVGKQKLYFIERIARVEATKYGSLQQMAHQHQKSTEQHCQQIYKLTYSLPLIPLQFLISFKRSM